MINAVIDLNDKEYKFNLSNLTEQDWNNFTTDFLANRIDIEGIDIVGYRLKIRDNVANIFICWREPGAYCEKQLLLNEFGRPSKDYQDFASKSLQNLMISHYGQEYVEELNANLKEVKNKSI